MSATETVTKAATASGRDGDGTVPHVLLVDDQPARLLTYESILEGVGVRCIRALSGREALEQLLKYSFAVILLDISMPEIDGFETARLIRAHHRFAHTPIVFVTGVHLSALDTLKGYEVGAIDYIQIPVVPEILRSKVALLVELYRRRAELEQLNQQLEQARQKLEMERELQSQTFALRLREQRSTALLRLADSFRLRSLPADIAYAAAEILGETLGVSRCGYGTIDPGAETITIERDWNAPGIQTIAGTLHFREYGTYIEELKRGETVVCNDADTDPRTRATAEKLKAISARSFVNMPVTEQSGTVALFYLNHVEARVWTPDELALMREFAERTRVAVERRRSEQAAAADLRDTRLLRDVGARLVSGDGQAIMDELLAAAMTITEADCGTVQLLEEDGRTLVFAATRNAPPELVSKFARVDASSGSPCGVALARSTRVVMRFDVPEAQDPDGSLRLHLKNGLRGGQSTPLVTRAGQPLGMFSTHWRTPRELSEREGRFLDLLSRQASDLIERLRADHTLREADRRKNEFIAMLAHELRNPLVPIRTGVKLLANAQQPGLVEKLRPMMDRQVEHMVRLIDDLLDVSRITSGKITLQRRRISLEGAITPAIDAHREALAAGRFDFTLDIADPHYVLDVDPIRFAQVVSNLLHNATKYTPHGGRIGVSAEVTRPAVPAQSPAMLRVVVSDSGVGIAAAELPSIFEMFQPRGGPRQTQSGLGIGLALSRNLVELHGGTIEVQSAGKGQGSRFVFQIPAPSDLRLSEDNCATGMASLAGAKVLIVDDNQDAADAVALLIKEMGAVTRVAYGGTSALSVLGDFAPHVVVLDIGMPGMDGYEVCERIRKRHGTDIAVLALTGWGEAAARDRAAKAGFDAHLTKPADPQALESVLVQLARFA